jgi:hypothetical protein
VADAAPRRAVAKFAGLLSEGRNRKRHQSKLSVAWEKHLKKHLVKPLGKRGDQRTSPEK